MSTLLLPNAARIIFCTTKTSSFVQREEVIPPMDLTPCSAWIAVSRDAAYPIASPHDTVRHGSVIDSRTIGESWRSRWEA